MPPIHPAIVHFPIALLTLSVIADLFGRVYSSDSLRSAGWWSLLGAAIGGALAVAAGLYDMNREEIEHATHERVHVHMKVGSVVLAAVVALTIWRWLIYAESDGAVSLIYLVAAFLTLGLTMFQGYLGGELVFADGVGVGPTGQGTEPPEKAEKRGAKGAKRENGHHSMKDMEDTKDMENMTGMKNMKSMYLNLAIMAVLSFISMFVFMYMMVDRFDDVYPSLNQFYMAGLMTAPMIVIEIFVMWSMYRNKKVNLIITGVSILLLVLFAVFIRKQTAISDKEFLKSMIPHHGGAVLMCDQASIEDAEIKDLCKGITSSQQSEIGWMKKKLAELDAK